MPKAKARCPRAQMRRTPDIKGCYWLNKDINWQTVSNHWRAFLALLRKSQCLVKMRKWSIPVEEPSDPGLEPFPAGGGALRPLGPLGRGAHVVRQKVLRCRNVKAFAWKSGKWQFRLRMQSRQWNFLQHKSLFYHAHAPGRIAPFPPLNSFLWAGT